jgi:hypothetical protein
MVNIPVHMRTRSLDGHHDTEHWADAGCDTDDVELKEEVEVEVEVEVEDDRRVEILIEREKVHSKASTVLDSVGAYNSRTCVLRATASHMCLEPP